MNGLSDLELYWMEKVQENEDIFNELINKEDNDKYDMWLTSRFIEFMKLIIKYNNLNSEIIVDGEVCKRVIRVHKNIPTKYLERLGYEYVIFNGLYVVMDVMLFDSSVLDNYFNKSKIHNLIFRDKVGIPDNTLYNIPKLVTINNSKKCCFLVKSRLTDEFIHLQSSWNFPTFGRD